MTEKPARKRRVERIEDWDEARYSVIPPRAALDLRLTLVHFRVLAYLGRVNTQEGWCELSQTAVAKAWSLARQTVNIAVGELVAWGYLQRRGQKETSSARCHYRVLIDDPELEGEGGDVSSPGDTPTGGTCHLQVTPVSSPEVTPVSPNKDTPLDQRSEITPPKPPEGGGGGDFSVDWIEELRAEGCAPDVLDHLLLPLLAAGLKPWKDVDPRLPARQLCEDFRRRSGPVLRAAADRLLDTHRYRLPPVAAVRAAVKAEGERAALVARQQRSAAPSEPELKLLRYERGTPEFDYELARWREISPAWADRIESQGFVTVKVRTTEGEAA